MRVSDLLFPGERTFRHALESPRAGLWIALILIGVGGLYGIWVAAFQLALGTELQGIPVTSIPTWLLFGGNVLAGMMIAVISHLGLALIAWLMVRAVGGACPLLVLYRTTAYLLPVAVLAAPWLALTGGAVSVGGAEGEAMAAMPRLWIYALLAATGGGLFLAGLFAMLRLVPGLAPFRAGFATALVVLFSLAILLIA